MQVFSLEFRNLRKSAIMWTASICSVIFLMLAFFPSMQTDEMQALAAAKLEGIDPAVLAVLGMKQMIDFTVISNFFGYVLIYITLAIMIYMTHMAVALFIKEESDGTIEYLYSKPISRQQLFFQKILTVLCLFMLMLFSFGIITVIGYLLFGEYSLIDAIKEALLFYGATFFVGVVYMSIGILMSTLIRNNRSINGISNGIVFGTFIIGAMSIFFDKLDFLLYFSPMDWIKAEKLLVNGIVLQEWIVGICVICICLALSSFVYKKRDFLV